MLFRSLSSIDQAAEQKDRLDILTGLMSSSEEELNENAIVDMDRVSEFRKRFSYSYPHENYKRLFAKTTVTELKEALYDETFEASLKLLETKEAEAGLPGFMKDFPDHAASGALRGTLYHRVMELLSTDSILNITDPSSSEAEKIIEDFLSDKEKEGCIDSEWRKLVDLKDISLFLSGDIAHRMAKACRRGT